MPLNIFVLRIFCDVWRRKPLKGIRAPHNAAVIPERLQRGAHEYASAPAPNTRLHEITRNLIPKHCFDPKLNVVETLPPDHRNGCFRPISAALAFLSVEFY